MEQNIIPEVPVKDLQLTATLPQEMVESQMQLLCWCDNKILVIKADIKELAEAVDIATSNKWNTQALKNQLTKARKSIVYYEKVKAALNEGYYIVPNFPVQMFAIRTKQKDPKGYSSSWWAEIKQDAQQLPQGEGEYRNPFPLLERQTDKDAQGKETHGVYPICWDELQFPITMAKPVIMQATSRAMALEIFDEIGVFPPTKKEDPVIIGRVNLNHKGMKRTVSFMIAWHFNTNQI
jgi:hypothetical protein